MSSVAATSIRPPVIDLEEAVQRYMEPGARVYLGNFGSQLFSVGHEMIRAGVRDIDVVIASGGILMDQLLGAGVLRSATFGHCWSPVGPAPAYNFRRAAESGDTTVALHEMSLGLLTAALTAGAWGLPFMPVPALTGTGYLDEDWSSGNLDTVTCGFGTAYVVRREAPDVAFVHVDRADEQGNGVIEGPTGEAIVAAQASTHVVLIAEELITDASLRQGGFNVPGVLVSAIVHQPGGVAPDGALGRYDRDVDAYEEYARLSRTPEGFQVWRESLTTTTPEEGRP
jgi:glutaconate CoA-transferase, subunit A